MNPPYTFTVFTPTYNRAHTLHRVYTSLCAQTFRDFEWLVIDDGSTDGTDALVAGWQSETNFPIRYIWKENGGAHTAHNRALDEARGRFFMPFGSDDACVPTALERLLAIWNSIPLERQHEYAFVRVLCIDTQGNVIGDEFPRDVYDGFLPDINYKDRIRGDKGGFIVTEILRRHPFPVLSVRTSHIPEGVVWMRIGARYLARCANERLQIVYLERGSLSRPAGGAHIVAPRIAPAFAYYYRQMLSEQARYARYDPATFGRAAANYVRFSFHQGYTLGRQWRQLNTSGGRALFVIGVAPGTAAYARDRLNAKMQEYVKPQPGGRHNLIPLAGNPMKNVVHATLGAAGIESPRLYAYMLSQIGPNRRTVKSHTVPGSIFFAAELKQFLGCTDAWLQATAREYCETPEAWKRLSGLQSATRRSDGFAKSMDVAEGFVLWALVKHVRPRVVVELGTQYGISARLWKEALRAYVPDHRLFLCDLVDMRRFIAPQDATFIKGDAGDSLDAILSAHQVDVLFNDAHPYSVIHRTVVAGLAARIPCFVFHDVGRNPERGRPFRPESHALSEAERYANDLNLEEYGHWERHCMADTFDSSILANDAAETENWRIRIFDSLYGFGVVLRK